MSVSRVLIRNDGVIYRFLKMETRPDGSILILLDRDRSVVREAQIFVDGRFVPGSSQSEEAVSHAKITCHTTGEVHYYNGGIRRQTFYIEPLFALSRTHTVGFFSVPRISRLDRYDGHADDVRAVLDLPSEIVERINFVVELAPSAPRALDSYGVALSYETYATVLRLIPRLPIDIPSQMSEHFVQGFRRPACLVLAKSTYQRRSFSFIRRFTAKMHSFFARVGEHMLSLPRFR